MTINPESGVRRSSVKQSVLLQELEGILFLKREPRRESKDAGKVTSSCHLRARHEAVRFKTKNQQPPT